MLIGVFDSGIGGLTVLRALRERWPDHSTLYLGDTARVPYGTKSHETVIRYARQNTSYLIDQGIELLVIACNTASAHALEALTDLPIPVIGVIEPGAEAAARAIAERTSAAHRLGVPQDADCAPTPAAEPVHVAVIGTAATIGSGAYERALHRLTPGVRISARACPLFVPIADEGLEDTEIAEAAARRYLADWLPGQPEHPEILLLGCTHYPVLKPLLSRLMGPESTLIDSAETTAHAVGRWLEDADQEDDPTHRICVTDGAPGFERTAARWLGLPRVRLEVIDLIPS